MRNKQLPVPYNKLLVPDPVTTYIFFIEDEAWVWITAPEKGRNYFFKVASDSETHKQDNFRDKKLELVLICQCVARNFALLLSKLMRTIMDWCANESNQLPIYLFSVKSAPIKIVCLRITYTCIFFHDGRTEYSTHKTIFNLGCNW